MTKEISDIRKILSREQKKHRFDHTTGVQYTSVCLAMRYGLSLEDAACAGVLHDCAKHMNDDELLSYCRKNNLKISEFEAAHPFLLHGKAGAFRAHDVFGVSNEDILNAIVWHTTGHPGMSMLEKIVFTADYIEPGRNEAPNLDRLRQMAFTDIDRAVCAILSQTLDYLTKSGSAIDLTTQETYNYYKNKVKMENIYD